MRFQKHLMPEVFRRKQQPNWAALFLKYDSNKDGLLSKDDLDEMMKEAEMKYATDAEVKFAFTVLAKHKPKLNLAKFVNWGRSMEGSTQKSLIMYTQYLNTMTMKIEMPKRFEEN